MADFVNYPIYDISTLGWKASKEHNIIFENPYLVLSFSSAESISGNLFERLDKCRYVDCSGFIYKVLAVHLEQKRGIERFIPFFKRIRIDLQRTGEYLSVSQFKEILLPRVNEKKDSELKKIIIDADDINDILKHTKGK